MREIKFRAWDKKHKLMYIINNINFNDNCATGVNNGEWYEFGIDRLMQYTGLKDKNGLEVYESDICKIQYSLDSQKNSYCEDGIVLIEYCDGSYWACSKEDKFSVIIDKQEVLEIIGNIYENPDLLNKI
jgi:uncharacterized phage protein (TIGR01671 family)